MESKVTVLTPNGRRKVIKVSPNTTVMRILEEACVNQEFSSEEYCLKHHNKVLSLSQTFRFSGLPNNCLLEMHRMDKKRVVQPVEICVQIEDGSRKKDKFFPDDNIWHVLKQLLGEDVLQNYNSPVVLYMRQEIFGVDQLSKVTLKSLGIMEGRALLRLLDKQLEELKTQAMVYKQPVPKTSPTDEIVNEKPKNCKNVVPGGAGFAITKDLVQNLKQARENQSNDSKKESVEHDEPSCSIKNNESSMSHPPKYDWGVGTGRSMRTSEMQMEIDEKENETPENIIEPEYHILGERNAVIYSVDSTHSQIENLPDSFYDLTVNDLKLVLRDLKKTALGNEEDPLLTEKQREIEYNNTMLRKIAQYRNCVIRIQFPDRHVLQGFFKPIDKILDVKQFVTIYLENPDKLFYLYTILPKTKLNEQKTLLELDFVPNALLHFSFEDDTENKFINSEYLSKLTTVEGAAYVASKLRKEKQSRSHNEYETRSVNVSTGAIPKRPRNDKGKNEN